MKRVAFSSNNDYKKSTKVISDPNFIPLCKINDLKAQKNGTKKTVFWVKKKKKQEDGTIKGEKWTTSQQYTGDWKENKKHGYGIKIYDNKDKYEGYWENDLRNGKGTYWLCIGKNKYRKLYSGDWKNNQKEGNGIYFYKDGSCYDGEWKNSKRDGKGLMIYANQDFYEGQWKEDLKDGYGVLEKKNGDKYYGHWKNGMKEGQGYYYYYTTGKVYLGEWHEDCPRTGILTDVKDDKFKLDISKINDPKDIPSPIPELYLANPEDVLEDSIKNIHFVRSIKDVKSKNLQDLFNSEDQKEIIKMYSALRVKSIRDEEDENKIPDYTITISDLRSIIYNNLNFNLNDEILELIFYAMGLPLREDTEVDFLLFVKIYYIIYLKINEAEEEMQEEDKAEYDMQDAEENPEEGGAEEQEEQEPPYTENQEEEQSAGAYEEEPM